MPDNGQIERMNRTIKDATAKRYHHDSHDQLRAHRQLFVDACNHARRLKALRWRTPIEAIHAVWQQKPDLFHQPPGHYSPGPNI
jgi:hypothetical protein